MVITKENISNLSSKALENLFGKDTKKTGASKGATRGKYNKDYFQKARIGRKKITKKGLPKDWWKNGGKKK